MKADQLNRAARNLRAARQRLDVAMKASEQAAINAHAEGTPETQIARTLGVNRMTVRRWLGKNRKGDPSSIMITPDQDEWDF